MNMRVGIDWGTHSSKWAYSAQGKVNLGDVVSSNLSIGGGAISLSQDGELVGLKRVAILDPKLNWDAGFGPTDVPYKALVAFSISSLIRAAVEHRAREAGGSFDDHLRQSELRLSFPNWIGDELAPTFAGLRQAASVAVRILLENPAAVPNAPGPARLDRFLSAYSSALASSKALEPSNEPMAVRDLVEFEDARIEIRYLMESVAAGLPSLEFLEGLTEDGRHKAIRYRRLLIVDSGAGSTDVGYMVLYRESEDEDYYFVYFRPCRQIPLGGNWLTDRLWEKLGKTTNSFSEAEDYKLSLSTADRSEPGRFQAEVPDSRDWISGIAQPTLRYTGAVPKHTHMHQNISTDLVLTGGSSVVPGLAEGLLNGLPTASQAAVARHGPTNLDFPPLATNVRVFQRLLPSYQRAGLGLNEQARRAVAHGLCMDLRHLIKYENVPNPYFRCEGGCADPGKRLRGMGDQWIGRM